MYKIIAIIPSYDLKEARYIISEAYTRAVTNKDILPIIIPYGFNIRSIKDRLGGILLIGGGDPDPYLWGDIPSRRLGTIIPNRDRFECEIVKFAYENNIPTLGICRGMQIMNVALGGSLYQDIYLETDSNLAHSQSSPSYYPTHLVTLNSLSILYNISQMYYIRVNSFHHQAVKETALDFFVSATSPDGIIEAIESKSRDFFIGVQWHPELMINDDIQRELFNRFINFSKKGIKEVF